MSEEAESLRDVIAPYMGQKLTYMLLFHLRVDIAEYLESLINLPTQDSVSLRVEQRGGQITITPLNMLTILLMFYDENK